MIFEIIIIIPILMMLFANYIIKLSIHKTICQLKIDDLNLCIYSLNFKHMFNVK